MTLRDRIADWISGGKLTEGLDDANKYMDWGINEAMRRVECEAALANIAALETPGANATVRKMARIAREALGE